jgi:hypothetical protein
MIAKPFVVAADASNVNVPVNAEASIIVFAFKASAPVLTGRRLAEGRRLSPAAIRQR